MDVRDYRDLRAIIPSFLDDFGLTPAQFRIYGRIARRVGKGGYCYHPSPQGVFLSREIYIPMTLNPTHQQRFDSGKNLFR